MNVYDTIQYIFISSLFINLVYWIIIFSKFPKSNQSTESIPSNQGVSVIISAKNESKNLQELIPLILNQDYSTFELIIANDCSTDDTIDIVNSLISNNKLSLINIKEDKPGKKHALSKAIEIAKFDHLLFTDADCRPNTNQWISSMMTYKNDKSLTIGFGPMFKKTGWLNKYIRYETFLTAIQYFSYASWNHAYMGVGRNMMFTKDLFHKNNGYQSHEHIKSGDDDLFINSMDDRSDVSCCITNDSFMYSKAMDNFSQYYRQKTRHFSTSSHYKWIDKMSLGLFAASHILIYMLFFVLLSTVFWKYTIISMLFRWLIIMIVHQKTFAKLDISDLLLFFPIMDFLSFIFYLIFTPASFFPKRNHW